MGIHPGESRLIGRSEPGGRSRRRSKGGGEPALTDKEAPHGATKGREEPLSLAGRVRELQQHIGIAFRDPSLLQEALTHSSFANENPHISPRDNERLEYLGDAVLQLISAEYLYKMRPEAKEGEMTQVRSAMVNTNTLATLSEELGIGNYLYLGKGIAKGGGRNLRSLLANAFEAVLGAIFLDAGYDAAFHYCLERFQAMPDVVQDENYKGMLQQVVQERFGVTPYYDSVGARGPGGRMREYTAVVYAGGDPLGTGHGRSKQSAEQSAAKDAVDKLLEDSVAGKRSRRGRRRGRAEEPRAAEPALAPGVPSTPDRPEPVESVLPDLQPQPEPVVRAAHELAPPAAPPSEKPRRRSRRKRVEETASSEPASGPPISAQTAPIQEPPARAEAPPIPEPPARAEAPSIPEPPARAEAPPIPEPPARTEAPPIPEPPPRAEAPPIPEPPARAEAPPARQLGQPMPQDAAAEPAEQTPAGKPRRPRRKTAAADDKGSENGISAPAGRSRRRPRTRTTEEEAPPGDSGGEPAPPQPVRNRQFGEPLP
jgi:ribonuclease-3